VGVEPGPVEQL